MVASIGAVAAPAQGASYYEKDGYYGKDDPEHREASAWAGRGAEELGLTGPVDADTFRAVLEGKVPDGSDTRLGRRGRDGEITHRPGRDLTLSAPKSVSLAALVGGDARVVEAHDRAVARTLAWFEKNVAETRMKDPETGRMVRTGGQKTVIATFRHDTSRNLDPALHTHAVIANMVQGEDGKWRSMANEKLYESKMLLGALYRSELAAGLARLGYGIEKTHADGRFEIAGVSREVVEAFSTRRQEIEAAVAERGGGDTADDQRLAQRAALMTRAAKRDVDREALRESWQRQAEGLGFDARGLAAEAVTRTAGRDAGNEAGRGTAAGPASGNGAMPGAHVAAEAAPAVPEDVPNSSAAAAVDWAVAHLSEREAVFARTDLLAAALAHSPGAAAVEGIEREVAAREKAGTLHAARLPGAEGLLTTDRAVADERETIALMRAGERAGRSADARPHRRQGAPGRPAHRRAEGGREADPVRQGPHGRRPGLRRFSGKTTMLRRARALHGEEGLHGARPRAVGLGRAHAGGRGRHRQRDPPALPRPLRRGRRRAHEPEGREGHARAVREDRAGRGRGLARLDRPGPEPAPDRRRAPHPPRGAGGRREAARRRGRRQALRPAPEAAGMKTAVMDEIMRQRDPALKEAVEASLAGDVARAFDRLGENVAEVKPDNLAGAAAARWLALSPEERARAGLMAPSHGLREDINAIVRERLVRDGTVHGPAMTDRTPRLARLHQCREDPRGQLHEGRCGRVPPPLQAPRGGQGRRAARRGRRAQDADGEAGRRGRAAPSPGSPTGSRRAPAASRSTAARRSSSGPATASAGPATTPASGWSTAARPRSRRSGTAGSRSASRTGARSTSPPATRSSATSTAPGPPPCTRSRAARSIP